MSIIDSVKRIEREGDKYGAHCEKLRRAIDDLACYLHGIVGNRVLPRGWWIEEKPDGFPRIARVTRTTEYANGGSVCYEGNDEQIDSPPWNGVVAQLLAEDVADGWLEEIADMIVDAGKKAEADAKAVQAAVDHGRGRC